MLSILGFTWNIFRQNFSEEEIRQIKNGFLKLINFFSVSTKIVDNVLFSNILFGCIASFF